MVNVQDTAVNRLIADRAQGPAPATPPLAPGGPGGPGGPAPGAPAGKADDPLATAINLLGAVVFRLSEVNPEAAEQLSGAVDNVRAIAEQIKQTKPAGGEKVEAPGTPSPRPAPSPAPAPGPLVG